MLQQTKIAQKAFHTILIKGGLKWGLNRIPPSGAPKMQGSRLGATLLVPRGILGSLCTETPLSFLGRPLLICSSLLLCYLKFSTSARKLQHVWD